MMGNPVEHNRIVEAIALSPDGIWLASGDAAGVVKVQKTGESRVVNEFQPHPFIAGLAFRGDSSTLVTTGLDRKLTIWRLPERISAQVLTLPRPGSARSLAVSADGKTIAIGMAFGSIELYTARE